MGIDTPSSRPNLYASLEAYGLKREELQKILDPTLERYGKNLSSQDRQKLIEGFLEDALRSVKKLSIYRERRNFYMDSEGKLDAEYGKDEKAKNAFLTREIIGNLIDTSLIPALALLSRANAPRVALGKYAYDTELFAPFQKEITRLDRAYGLDVWQSLTEVQNAGGNIGDESVRKKIYEGIVRKLKPDGSTWILEMLKHGNWRAMSGVRGYTDVQIGAPNDPRSDVVEIIQMYESEIVRFTQKNGELYKMRLEFQKNGSLPTETRYFGDIIPEIATKPPHVEGKLNTLHYLLFKWFGGQGIENAIAGIRENGKSLSPYERLESAGEGLLNIFMWSKMTPNAWKFDAFGKSVEALMKTANAMEKTQILAVLTRLFPAKHPFIKKLASI